MAPQQKQQQALALPAAGHAQGASGWRRGAELIDALPYIDTISAEERAAVDALIDEECQRSAKRPSDYLAELPPLPPMKFEGHPVLAAEYERVRSKQPMPPLDTSRYRLDPPPQSRRSDERAWKAALDNARAQLEHQANRIQNLELLLKFGDKGWRAQTQLQESSLKQVEADLASARATVTALNQERKLSQLAAGGELGKLHNEYMGLLAKNLSIEVACEALEEEIHRLKEAAATQQGQGGQGGSETAGAVNGTGAGADGGADVGDGPGEPGGDVEATTQNQSNGNMEH